MDFSIEVIIKNVNHIFKKVGKKVLLVEIYDIKFKTRKLVRKNFQSCCRLIDYLNERGVTNAMELVANENILYESCASDLDINLFMAYFVFDDYPIHSKNQVYLSELIIHLFFTSGIDLMKPTEVKEFFVIAASYFPGCFPNYNRKILGSIIRKSVNLISYKQGGYVLKKDVEHHWKKGNLKSLQEKIKRELMNKSEINPKQLFEEYKGILLDSKIYNSHYMFSVLKELNTDNEIIYYRNTFNSKIRRKK